MHTLIQPKRTWRERLHEWYGRRSPEERHGLIALVGGIPLLILGYCLSSWFSQQEIGALRDRIGQLEYDNSKLQFAMQPFSNAVIQIYGRADAEAMKKLARHLSAMTADVKSAQHELKTLQSSEYQAPTMASMPTNEIIPGKDKRRVAVLATTNNATRVFLLLQDSPIRNNIQAVAQNWVTKGQEALTQPGVLYNVVLYNFADEGSLVVNNLIFHLTYLKDLRQTNRIKSLEVKDGRIYFDGMEIPAFGAP
jgi:hypothetical protein